MLLLRAAFFVLRDDIWSSCESAGLLLLVALEVVGVDSVVVVVEEFSASLLFNLLRRTSGGVRIHSRLECWHELQGASRSHRILRYRHQSHT